VKRRVRLSEKTPVQKAAEISVAVPILVNTSSLEKGDELFVFLDAPAKVARLAPVSASAAMAKRSKT
jgi:hypothetical protein